LLHAYDYLVLKGFKGVSDLPADMSKFPAYSQVAAMFRFVKYAKRAEALKADWDKLHARVFDPDPKARPTVAEIEKTVGGLFAPPKPKPGGGPKHAVQESVVKPETVADWYKKVAPDGKLVIAEITVAKLTASALAAAIEANWKAVSGATLLQVRVAK